MEHEKYQLESRLRCTKLQVFFSGLSVKERSLYENSPRPFFSFIMLSFTNQGQVMSVYPPKEGLGFPELLGTGCTTFAQSKVVKG